METKQIMVLVSSEPKRMQALVKELESKQINVNAIDWGYDIGYGAFTGYMNVALPDRAMQALKDAGFAVFSVSSHESLMSKSSKAEPMAICA